MNTSQQMKECSTGKRLASYSIEPHAYNCTRDVGIHHAGKHLAIERSFNFGFGHLQPSIPTVTGYGMLSSGASPRYKKH